MSEELPPALIERELLRRQQAARRAIDPTGEFDRPEERNPFLRGLESLASILTLGIKAPPRRFERSQPFEVDVTDPEVRARIAEVPPLQRALAFGRELPRSPTIIEGLEEEDRQAAQLFRERNAPRNVGRGVQVVEPGGPGQEPRVVVDRPVSGGVNEFRQQLSRQLETQIATLDAVLEAGGIPEDQATQLRRLRTTFQREFDQNQKLIEDEGGTTINVSLADRAKEEIGTAAALVDITENMAAADDLLNQTLDRGPGASMARNTTARFLSGLLGQVGPGKPMAEAVSQMIANASVQQVQTFKSRLEQLLSSNLEFFSGEGGSRFSDQDIKRSRSILSIDVNTASAEQIAAALRETSMGLTLKEDAFRAVEGLPSRFNLTTLQGVGRAIEELIERRHLTKDQAERLIRMMIDQRQKLQELGLAPEQELFPVKRPPRGSR